MAAGLLEHLTLSGEPQWVVHHSGPWWCGNCGGESDMTFPMGDVFDPRSREADRHKNFTNNGMTESLQNFPCASAGSSNRDFPERVHELPLSTSTLLSWEKEKLNDWGTIQNYSHRRHECVSHFGPPEASCKAGEPSYYMLRKSIRVFWQQPDIKINTKTQRP